MRKDGRRSRKNLSGKLEFEWTPERPERLSGGSLLQVAGTARAEFRQGGDGGAAPPPNLTNLISYLSLGSSAQDQGETPEGPST